MTGLCSEAINIAWFLWHLNVKFYTELYFAMPLQAVPVPKRPQIQNSMTPFAREIRPKMTEKISRTGTPEVGVQKCWRMGDSACNFSP